MYKYNINFPILAPQVFRNVVPVKLFNISGFALADEGWRSKSKLLVNFQLWRSVYLFTSADKTNSNSLFYSIFFSVFVVSRLFYVIS